MSILIPYWWVVPCLGFLYAAHRSIGVFTALRLVFYYPVVVGILKAASYAPRLFPSSFPYNPEMILKNVNYIAEGIRSNPAHRARFADVVGPCNGWRRDVGLEFEPVKERTTIKLVLSYPKKDGTNLEIRIFCKCTGMRNISIWLRGLGSAFTSVPKEIGFYAEINRGDGLVIPPTVVVPTMLFGRYNVTLDRTLLVLETLPECYATIPDFKGITFAQARVLMGRSARFHGANWNPDPKKVVPYMVKRKGLDFLEVVDMYKKGYPKTYYVRVWDALKRYFEKKLDTMALCHCDCRPGNMLFRTAFWESAPAKPADDKWYDSVPDDAIIFTDWEANGVAPVMWDAAYTILTGLRLPDRRQYEAELIKHYITELRKSVPAAAAKSLADEADLMMQWRLSTVLIHFYGWTLSVIGCVGDNHGNCREDSYEWSLRTHQGVIDATVDVDAIAAALGIDAQDIRDLRADQQYLLDDLKVPAGVTKPELPFRAAFQGQQQ